MKSLVINSDELNPYIRRVGKQGITGWENKLRKLYDYEMLYVHSGKAKINISTESALLTEGMLALIPPNTSSTLNILDENSDITYVHFDFVFFSNEDIDYNDWQAQSKNSIRPQILLQGGRRLPTIYKVSNLSNTVKELEDSFACKMPFWQLKCKSLLLEILFHMFSKYEEPQCREPLSKERINQDILKYIHYHYNCPLTLQEISDYVGISKNHANNLFKQRTGKTIMNYVITYRLEKAIKLIKDSDLAIKDVCYEVGFDNSHYFSRIMKQYTGKTPKEYR